MTVYFFYPQIKKLTGAQRLILKLAQYVAAEGVDVAILTHRFAPECRPALDPRVRLIETGRRVDYFGNHYLDSLLEYILGPVLVEHSGANPAAICFFGPPSLPALWWAKRIRRLRAPCLYFCYEPPRAAYTDRRLVAKRLGIMGPLFSMLLLLYRPLDRYFVSQATAIMANSEFGRTLIQEAYGRDATVIAHGVDFTLQPQAREEIRTRYGIPLNAPLALTVNSLHPRKRIDLLIEALALVRRTHPEARALIVGAGPEEVQLAERARSLGLSEAITFTGFVSDDELAAHYAAADVYVHTGKVESFGLSVIEAAAAGKPVIAVDEGGPRETIIPGETGELVPATAEAIAAALGPLFSDPHKATLMGKAGTTRIAANYRWETGARTFLKLAARSGARRLTRVWR